ncbi:hypothetical protein AMELA_G00254560 [Ameiurus melas]|uniref:Uncharacterized protein n=1 Tax=Ameiurus melas TaxID=219545 RepID=A0A7J5ZV13_AMEME|nr:hypothetical protein AMELA_G00254560 [Ameiurus melas]
MEYTFLRSPGVRLTESVWGRSHRRGEENISGETEIGQKMSEWKSALLTVSGVTEDSTAPIRRRNRMEGGRQHWVENRLHILQCRWLQQN